MGKSDILKNTSVHVKNGIADVWAKCLRTREKDIKVWRQAY